MSRLKPSINQALKLTNYQTTKPLSNQTFKLSSYQAIKAPSLIAHTKLTAHIEDRMACQKKATKASDIAVHRSENLILRDVSGSSKFIEKPLEINEIMPKRRPAEMQM